MQLPPPALQRVRRRANGQLEGLNVLEGETPAGADADGKKRKRFVHSRTTHPARINSEEAIVSALQTLKRSHLGSK